MQAHAHTEPPPLAAGGFGHVVIGVDETPESLVAAAQAEALRADDAHVVLVAAAERHLASHAGLSAAHAEHALVAGTLDELERAKAIVDTDDTVVGSGRLVDLLVKECSRRDATLIAVGARPHGRLSAAVFGGHEVDALHSARCSLLIARPGWGPAKPDRIVVAVDGTRESRTAEAVARSLGARLGCAVFPVISLDDHVDPELLRTERKDALLEPGPLATAVVAACTPGTLAVVGRAERHGRRADVAEKIVWSARCSVLVVQGELAASG
jgi:nucleotide-binding universal stress UspA family protein